jgi:HSP20 family protein
MKKPALKTALIGLAVMGGIGVVAAQTYYTHEIAQRIADRPDAGAPALQSPTASGQWNPWAEMQRMQARFEREFARSFDAFRVALPDNPHTTDTPQITVEQQGDNYVVKADIPGAKEGDIQVNLDGRLLSISSQSQNDRKKTADNGAVTSESRYSSAFEQIFTLPGPVAVSGMKSDFKDGVLTLTIPRAHS